MTLEFYRDKNHEYRWRLRANNNKIIAESGEGYENRKDCETGWKLTALAGEDYVWETGEKGLFSADTHVMIAYPCSVHPDDSVCEASGRAGCHA